MIEDIFGASIVRWIPLLPAGMALVHALAIGLLRRPFSDRAAGAMSCLAVGGSFALSLFAFADLVSGTEGQIRDHLCTWIGIGVGTSVFNADMGFVFDPLSAVMCIVVCGVGLLIHLYSLAYMSGDERPDRGFQRFFCLMNLFVAAMLVLVLADNLLLLFLGWEGVGLCSYLLIGFWYGDSKNAEAGSKAFIVNRIGDLGLLIGILLLFWKLSEGGAPSMSFSGIHEALSVIEKQSFLLPSWMGGRSVALASVIGLLIFFGAIGKSAQLPLFVWLPDAMAGPTPVSALIHAATMVTAGVYLVARLSFLYAIAPEASNVIAWVGAGSALFAASAACVQTDIKRLLAYSTMSQLGLMFLAAGVGAYTASIYHLLTHAFIKALLFMGAGVVILALRHQQDLRAMGGLGNRLIWTRNFMWVAALALAGVPPLSGFFSKDMILTASWIAGGEEGLHGLFWTALAAVVLTGFYITRLMLLVFAGEPRGRVEPRREVRDPGGVMLWPIGILAGLAAAGGVFGVSQFWGDMLGVPNSNSIHHFLAGTVGGTDAHGLPAAMESRLVGRSIAALVTGLLLAVVFYVLRPNWREAVLARVPNVDRLLENAYYVDAAYRVLIVEPLAALSDRFLARFVDERLIDGLAVMGTAALVRGTGERVLRRLQTGLVQTYAVVALLGLLGILLYLLFGSPLGLPIATPGAGPQ